MTANDSHPVGVISSLGPDIPLPGIEAGTREVPYLEVAYLTGFLEGDRALTRVVDVTTGQVVAERPGVTPIPMSAWDDSAVEPS